MDQNEGIFVRFMNDPEFQKVVTTWMASEAYKRLRGEESAVARSGEGKSVRLRIVQPRPEEKYVTCLPLVPLRAAAGAFSHPQAVENGEWQWVKFDNGTALREGMFVAQVAGRSMEPIIPDGSYCLFRTPVEGSRLGKIVLVELRDEIDPETGERYTVKRYESEKVTAEEGGWRHVKVTLKPANKDFAPIALTSDDDGQLRVVAEFLQVLGKDLGRD